MPSKGGDRITNSDDQCLNVNQKCHEVKRTITAVLTFSPCAFRAAWLQNLSFSTVCSWWSSKRTAKTSSTRETKNDRKSGGSPGVQKVSRSAFADHHKTEHEVCTTLCCHRSAVSRGMTGTVPCLRVLEGSETRKDAKNMFFTKNWS